ncbi:type VI secretion system protein TssR domain-containing protein [Taibaiella koreensis]|uniref:type VI secretion system protein TssR domain-containing protein n=1 Tax=Taibaiella koreensis TaxID=1268548 RepID=UPI000E59965F|nr:type VI secretion system protein TssR domain-containing protein [Taibaiella koreensis]
MRAFAITVFTLISAAIPLCSQAQFGLFNKNYMVMKNPGSGAYNLQDADRNLSDGLPISKDAWIVYSDQSNNTTYKSPGGDAPFKTLKFMQPCYVVKKKGEYVELAQYQPGQKINGRKISKNSADNLGWIHKDKLLLWSYPLRDGRTKFPVKAITAYDGENAFSLLPNHVSGDSLMLFGSPFLKNEVSKCSMESIFYIYKKSNSGNEYLVGATPVLFADSAGVTKTGWISKDLISVWGTRSVFMLNDQPAKGKEKKSQEAGISFYSDTTFLNREKRLLPLILADNERQEDNSLLENLYPINAFYRTTNGTSLIKTAVLTDALDRSKNEVYNVSGNRITYAEFKRILKDNTRLNIVFVADGGAENAKYMNQLYSILQNLELQLNTSKLFKKVRIGSVVYKDNLRDCRNAIAPLTSDYKNITDFWAANIRQAFSCNDEYSEQAVFSGLADASEMLYKNKGESNIIVLFGGAGNNRDGGSNWSDVISRLSYVNARLFIFQSHSLSDPAYNSYVVQAKDLVVQSAANIADLKKEKLVDYTASVLSSSDFSLIASDSGVFNLNYPNQAMHQGYVLFPPKGEVMRPSLLSANLDSLIVQINRDNKLIEESLYRNFQGIGARNTKVDSKYAFKYPMYSSKTIPAEFMRSNSLRTQSFYIPAWTSVAVNDTNRSLKTGLLLNADEYQQLINRLQTLGGNKSFKGRNKDAIYDQVTGAVAKAVKERKLELGKPVSDLTFSEALEVMTGYRSLDPVWLSTSLKAFKHSNAMNLQDGQRFVEESSRKAAWLRDNINNNQIQFSNNGRTYYLITEDKLPGGRTGAL